MARSGLQTFFFLARMILAHGYSSLGAAHLASGLRGAEASAGASVGAYGLARLLCDREQEATPEAIGKPGFLRAVKQEAKPEAISEPGYYVA